jgi:hypothetical protein
MFYTQIDKIPLANSIRILIASKLVSKIRSLLVPAAAKSSALICPLAIPTKFCYWLWVLVDAICSKKETLD